MAHIEQLGDDSLLLQKQTQDISLLQIFQLSNTVLHPYQSVQCVCVCVCVCVCYNAITGSTPSYLSELLHLPTLSALHQTHACLNSNVSTTKPMAFTLSHTSVHTSGTIYHIRHSAFFSFKSKLKTFLFSKYFS